MDRQLKERVEAATPRNKLRILSSELDKATARIAALAIENGNLQELIKDMHGAIDPRTPDYDILLLRVSALLGGK